MGEHRKRSGEKEIPRRGRPIRQTLTQAEAAYLYLSELHYKLEQRVKALEKAQEGK